MRWQPIETAPKDGTRLMLYCGGIHYLGWFDMKLSQWVAHGLRFIRPTHWTPLDPPR